MGSYLLSAWGLYLGVIWGMGFRVSGVVLGMMWDYAYEL